jgi:hypothetical protein
MRRMIRASSFRPAAALVASLLALESCHEGLIYAPASGLTASADVRASFDASVGSNGAAFDKVDRVSVQISVGSDVRVQQEASFTPSAGVAVIRLEVPLQQTSEDVTASVELRSNGRALFRGTATPKLSVGARTPVNLTLTPVVASVVCGPDLQIGKYGPAGRLQGAALFATGDTILGASVTWTGPANAAATVSSAGDVNAVKDGDVQVDCASGTFTGTRVLHVLAVVAKVQVSPPVDTIPVGGSVTLSRTLTDSGGAVIPTARTVSWASNNAAAKVDASSGLVTGVSVGAATITATSGSASGTAQIVVVNPLPVVSTNPATNIGGAFATLNGTVRPNGPSVTAWFEWSTDSSLASPQSTTPQVISNVTTDVPFSEAVNGLAPGGTYFFRAVAANSDGARVRGAIIAFTTPQRPSVTTRPVTTDVTATGSTYTLHATINPNGTTTTAWFQLVVTPINSSFIAPPVIVLTPTVNIGSGTASVDVSMTLTATPFSSYVISAIASNAGGTTTGNTVAFTSAGLPVFGQTSGGLTTTCGAQCASMSSQVIPNGAPTAAWFEVGSDTTLSSFTTSARQPLGSGSAFVTIFADVPTAAGTPVYFRVAASNALGTVRTVVFRAFFPVILDRRP